MEASKTQQALAKVREKHKNGELKTKKKEGSKRAAWKKFHAGVVHNDDWSAGYAICNSCEIIYVFDSLPLSLMSVVTTK